MQPTLIFLLSSLILLSHAQIQFDYPSANLNTTWINNHRFASNSINFISGAKARIILLKSSGGPSFACGFYCFPPCHGFLFSIFLINTTIFSELLSDILHDIPFLWSANRERLVDWNATLHFTKAGDLILLDSDGTFVWSTNTSNRSVSSLNLTSFGNLMLLNDKNETVWSSFDHPTDTLLNGQTLKLGQSLTSNYLADNTTRGMYYLLIQEDGFYAYVNSSPPQLYFELFENVSKITPAYNLTLKDGHLIWPDGNAKVIVFPENWAVLFIRLDYDGHLRVYGIGQNFNQGLTMLSDLTNFLLGYCDYPMACGEYGICSERQCSCPVNVSDGDSSFFQTYSRDNWLKSCSPVNQISCQSAENHRLLPLGNISYFNYIDPNAAALRGTDEETCKQACLMNCSCKAAFFKYGGDFLHGDCYLPTEIFSLKNSVNYSSSAYIKMHVHMAPPITSDHSSADHSSKEKSNRISVFIAMLGSLLLTSSVILVIILRFRRRRSEEIEYSDQFDRVRGALIRFSFDELYIATQGFNRKLGQGGFGSVFWGTLRDGNEVAVKKLEGLGQGKNEFLAEVETIGSIHHINLVELVGFCAEKSHRLLVYEYMPNGSLDQWIFRREHKEKEEEEEEEEEWKVWKGGI
ncbi:G-type lectin S-receptor-like serine/threonine-protein kinase SD2-5 [Phalaenopsis equestris]|uniref:G-type lectin S-receptor-like serine/threonine-protein kinase SD2-5 n=1 Tax=Phalaenopsis equestris TaxID=78828 RepID=UPI0009E49F5B|nr:G-type lectin S-receptor-like serine/threonine-protein kinase SD2-5 [Phalaenopsis equestris]